MAEICQRVLDGLGMPDEWALGVVAPIFNQKGDIRNCSSHRAVKLVEHGMNVVKMVVEKRLHKIIIIMVIFRCYFSRQHIALSYKKWCEHRIMKNQQIKSTVHDAKSYLK